MTKTEETLEALEAFAHLLRNGFAPKYVRMLGRASPEEITQIKSVLNAAEPPVPEFTISPEDIEEMINYFTESSIITYFQVAHKDRSTVINHMSNVENLLDHISKKHLYMSKRIIVDGAARISVLQEFGHIGVSSADYALKRLGHALNSCIGMLENNERKAKSEALFLVKLEEDNAQRNTLLNGETDVRELKLPAKILSHLDKEKIISLQQLTRMTNGQILEIKGIGKKSVEAIREYLDDYYKSDDG